MIGFLAVISFAAGVIAPFIATVAFVLYFSFVAASVIAAFSLLYGASVWMAVAAWLATIVAMQAGFALSMLAMAALQQREQKRLDAPGEPIMDTAGQDRAPEGAVHDDQRNAAGS